MTPLGTRVPYIPELLPRTFDACDSTPRAARDAWAGAVGRHGEILHGVIEKPRGRLRRVRVALVCPMARSIASFSPAAEGDIRVDPAWKSKSRRAAALVLAWLGHPVRGGLLRIESTIPAGGGLGSSTADVTAAARAVAGACGTTLPASVIARLAVEAEGVSDATMCAPRAVVFAPDEGCVVEDLGGELPPVEVIGCHPADACARIEGSGRPRARYTCHEIESFRPLLGALRRAIEDQDPRFVGRVATASARINQRFVTTPQFDRLQAIGARHGALGVQVAHAGGVVGILFDPSHPRLEAAIAGASADLRTLGLSRTYRFLAGAS